MEGAGSLNEARAVCNLAPSLFRPLSRTQPRKRNGIWEGGKERKKDGGDLLEKRFSQEERNFLQEKTRNPSSQEGPHPPIQLQPQTTLWSPPTPIFKIAERRGTRHSS